MAEIKIERKKLGWPWIIVGVVVAALLISFLVFRDNTSSTEAASEADFLSNTNESDLAGVKDESAVVAAYVNFVENSKKEMSLDHAYTNEALLKLINATNAKANEVGYVAQADLAKVKEYANRITKDPFETTHADNIRAADDILTIVLQNIQKANYPDLTDEADELKSASQSIKPGVLALEQQGAIKNYFAKASDLLQKMN